MTMFVIHFSMCIFYFIGDPKKISQYSLFISLLSIIKLIFKFQIIFNNKSTLTFNDDYFNKSTNIIIHKIQMATQST